MLFNEIYSNYYNAVSAVISMAVEGRLTDKAIYDIVRSKAFSESLAAIPDALKKGGWPFLTQDNRTVIEHKPILPITHLEKRWLKAVLNDRRIKLFAQPIEWLEDIEPLFDNDDFVYFDRYADGDPYGDEKYIENFRIIMGAVKEKRRLRIEFNTQHGDRRTWVCIPEKLEYSSKDDKFRLIISADNALLAVNMARVTFAEALEKYGEHTTCERAKKELVLELTDIRNALERAMLHFSHFEKETKKLDDTHYSIKLRYAAEDESELIIRVLSFGTALKVASPVDFADKIRDRLARQRRISEDRF